jgi:hypothetical protein
MKTFRRRPAFRRSHETVAVEHDGPRYKIGLGSEPTCHERGLFGPIAEIFLNAQQINSSVNVLASDGAILMSLLLPYG